MCLKICISNKISSDAAATSLGTTLEMQPSRRIFLLLFCFAFGFCKFFYFPHEMQLLYNVVLVSAVQHESAACIQTSPPS